MNKKGIFIVIAVVVVGLLCWLFLGNKSGIRESDFLKIGAVLPLTGKYADAGNSVKVGLELAVREINDTAKFKYEIIYYNTDSDVKTSTTGFMRLRQINNVEVFFTTTSDHSLTLKPFAIRDSVLLFALGSDIDITKDNHRLVYRPINTGIDEGEAMLKFINDSLAAQNIFLYAINTAPGISFTKFIESNLSNKLLDSYLYNEDVSLLKSITANSQIKKSDCIIVFGFTPMIGSIIKSLREFGYKGNIVSNTGFNNPSVFAVAGDYAKSTYYVDYDLPFQSIEFQKKDSIAKKEFNTSFSMLSQMAYSTVHLINNIGKNDVSIKDIQDFLSKEMLYDIGGTLITTKPDGSITTSMTIRQY